MKFAAVVILYDPSQEDIDLISNYSEFDLIYVIDNTEGFMGERKFPVKNIKYIRHEENLGISISINEAIEMCKEDAVDYLCTMDQDSVFGKEDISRIMRHISDYDMSEVGIVAPTIVYNKERKPAEIHSAEIKKWVITSGSFVNLANINQHGIKYDENYFIDRCDLDFCYQMYGCGLKVLCLNDAFLYQKLGVQGDNGNFNHSPIRHYYMYRNRLYFNKKWFGGFKAALKSFLQSAKHRFIVLFFENNKKQKMALFRDAKRDFKLNNMGKRQ